MIQKAPPFDFQDIQSQCKIIRCQQVPSLFFFRFRETFFQLNEQLFYS